MNNKDWRFSPQSRFRNRKNKSEGGIPFGEDPEDVIGPDWENYVNEYAESEIGEHNERTEISN